MVIWNKIKCIFCCKECKCICPPGPPGPGSTLYYAAEQGSSVEIPTGNFVFPVMDVSVTTTEANQRVKLDATVSTLVIVDPAFDSFQFGIAYTLRRNGDILTFAGERGNLVRDPSNGGAIYDYHPNFTYVDVPGPPGTYTYQVIANSDFNNIGISNFLAYNLGLTAQVFPPGPPPT
jgi:hypothetical protein